MSMKSMTMRPAKVAQLQLARNFVDASRLVL